MGKPEDKIHPYVVLTNPVEGRVLIVNFSDHEHDPDAECVVKHAELPKILKKDSFLFFAKTSEVTCEKMPKLLAENQAIKHLPDLPPEILDRVLRCAKLSRDIPDRLKIKYGISPAANKTTAPF